MAYKPDFSDKWKIVDSERGNITQAEVFKSQADKARDILNDHETRNGRKPVYVVEEIERCPKCKTDITRDKEGRAWCQKPTCGWATHPDQWGEV